MDNLLALRILDELRDIRVLVENKLMSQKDCADYMGVSLRHFREHYSHRIEWIKVGERLLRCRKIDLINAINNDTRSEDRRAERAS